MPRVRTQQVVTLVLVILVTLVMASLAKILTNVHCLSLTVERTQYARIYQDQLTVLARLVMKAMPKLYVMISMNVPRVATTVTNWQHVTTQKEVLRVRAIKVLRVLEFNVETPMNVKRELLNAISWQTVTTHLVDILAYVNLGTMEQERSVQMLMNASLVLQLVMQDYQDEQIVPTRLDHITALVAAGTKEMVGIAQILTNVWKNLPAIKTQLVPTMVEAIPVPATKDLLVPERIAKTRMNVMMNVLPLTNVVRMLTVLTKPLDITVLVKRDIVGMEKCAKLTTSFHTKPTTS
jgi:hypothetical protein